MNKTVTINISGIIFHIEEDAYDTLGRYLSAIKGYFSRTDGGNEIMTDIEARIAELLQEKLNPSKQVILAADVAYVMSVMGRPEDFGSDQGDEQKTTDTGNEFAQEKIKRRLFRNPDEKAIGGVCSGLAAYFDIDTVWVRLAMFLLIFFGGLSLWVYIILWIVIPEAKTTAEKFAMRGESANINSIFKSFKEEAEDVKNRINKYGKDIREQRYGDRISSNIGDALSTVFNIIGRLFGLFLIFLGTIFLLVYAGTLLGISVVDTENNITNWKSVIFDSGLHYNLAIFAFIIVIGIPVFMLLYVGIKLLFRIRYSNRWLNLSLGLLWLVGLLAGIYVTMATVKEFGQVSRLKESTTLKGVGDTLIVKLNPVALTVGSWPVNHKADVESDLSLHHGGYRFAEIDDKVSLIGFANLDIVESGSDSIELIINYSARGATKKEANENARAIKYSYVQKDNELVFDEVFRVMEGMKFRTQEVDIKIRLPIGTVIYLDNSIKYLLDDADNVSHTWEGDMVARRWEMTSKGLKCIDCDNLRTMHGEEIHGIPEPPDPPNPPHPIDIHSNDADVKINKDGIRIRSREANVDINSDGIQVEKKKKEGDN